MEFVSEPSTSGVLLFLVYAIGATILSNIWATNRPVPTNDLIQEKGKVWVFWYNVQSWAVPSALIVSTIVMMEFTHDLPMLHFLRWW